MDNGPGHPGVIRAGLAAGLSMSLGHKNIFFEMKKPEVKLDD